MVKSLAAYSEKSCTLKFQGNSSSYQIKASRLGKTPGRIGIRLVEGQQHRNATLMLHKTSPAAFNRFKETKKFLLQLIITTSFP